MHSFESPTDVLRAWIDAVNSLHIDNVVALYNDKASLLPTFSPHAADTCEKTRHYFEQLGSRPNMSVSLHEKTVRAVPVRDDIHAIYGIYHFSFDIDDDLMTFASRFTFVIDLTQERPILHHHSSMVPRTLS